MHGESQPGCTAAGKRAALKYGDCILAGMVSHIKDLRDAVVVITGASSGVGRATALAFAQRGARLVLAARRENALLSLAEECEKLGARSSVSKMDVTDMESVAELARQAIENFGRIDIWVNNAGVTAFGKFEDIPLDSFRQVIETNFFGYVYGARVAIRQFKRQGFGVLINSASIASKMGEPYLAPYVASEHAIRGLGASLRQELYLDGFRDIHVCTVMSAMIDTPLLQHAANYTGLALGPMHPVYPVEQVARTIVDLSRSPRREAFVGSSGRMLNLQHILAPGLTEKTLAVMVDRMHLDHSRSAEPTHGNLFHVIREGSGISGGLRQAQRSTFGALAAGVLLISLPIVVEWAFWRSSSKNRLEARRISEAA